MSTVELKLVSTELSRLAMPLEPGLSCAPDGLTDLVLIQRTLGSVICHGDDPGHASHESEEEQAVGGIAHETSADASSGTGASGGGKDGGGSRPSEIGGEDDHPLSGLIKELGLDKYARVEPLAKSIDGPGVSDTLLIVDPPEVLLRAAEDIMINRWAFIKAFSAFGLMDTIVSLRFDWERTNPPQTRTADWNPGNLTGFDRPGNIRIGYHELLANFLGDRVPSGLLIEVGLDLVHLGHDLQLISSDAPLSAENITAIAKGLDSIMKLMLKGTYVFCQLHGMRRLLTVEQTEILRNQYCFTKRK